MEMAKGRAKGGPRDGIILEASPNWDGKIKLPADGNAITFYPGYYRWEYNECIWMWIPEYTQAWKVGRQPNSRAY